MTGCHRALCPDGPGAQVLSAKGLCARGGVRQERGEVASCPGLLALRGSRAAQEGQVASMGQGPPHGCYFVPAFEHVLLKPSKLVHSPVQSNSFSPKPAELGQGKRKGETRGAGQGAPHGQVSHAKEVRGLEKMCFQMRHSEAFHWLAPTPI